MKLKVSRRLWILFMIISGLNRFWTGKKGVPRMEELEAVIFEDSAGERS